MLGRNFQTLGLVASAAKFWGESIHVFHQTILPYND